MQQAADFLDETHALAELIAPLSDADYLQETAFKRWTIDMVLRHLHFWNKAALLSVTDEAAFESLVSGLTGALRQGALPDHEEAHFDGLSGRALRNAWLETASRTADVYLRATTVMRSSAPGSRESSKVPPGSV